LWSLGGDYVLALKGNHGTLAADVALMFTEGRATGFQGIAHDTYTTTEKDHGRLEIRRHWTIQDPEYIAYLNPTGHWAGLRGVGMVEEERRVGARVSTACRYYILKPPPGRAALWRRRAQPLGRREPRPLDPRRGLSGR